MNQSVDPQSFRWKIESSKADSTIVGATGGGRYKPRLILEGLDSQVVKIASKALTQEQYLEDQPKLTQLSFFRRWVPVKLGDLYASINISSAAKRLGVSAEKVFQAAKSGTFEKLFKEESGHAFSQSGGAEHASTESFRLKKASLVARVQTDESEKVTEGCFQIHRDGSIFYVTNANEVIAYNTERSGQRGVTGTLKGKIEDWTRMHTTAAHKMQIVCNEYLFAEDITSTQVPVFRHTERILKAMIGVLKGLQDVQDRGLSFRHFSLENIGFDVQGSGYVRGVNAVQEGGDNNIHKATVIQLFKQWVNQTDPHRAEINEMIDKIATEGYEKALKGFKSVQQWLESARNITAAIKLRVHILQEDVGKLHEWCQKIAWGQSPPNVEIGKCVISYAHSKVIVDDLNVSPEGIIRKIIFDKKGASQIVKRNLHDELARSRYITDGASGERSLATVTPNTPNDVMNLFGHVLRGLVDLEKIGVVLQPLRKDDIVQDADGSWVIGNRGGFNYNPAGLQANIKEASQLFANLLGVSIPTKQPPSHREVLCLLHDMQKLPASQLMKKYAYFFAEYRGTEKAKSMSIPKGSVVTSEYAKRMCQFIESNKEDLLEEAQTAPEGVVYRTFSQGLNAGYKGIIAYRGNGTISVTIKSPPQIGDGGLITVIDYDKGSVSLPAKGPSLFAKVQKITTTTDVEMQKMLAFIAEKRSQYQAKAAEEEYGQVYIRATDSGYARGIQFFADGSVWIHFNKKELGDASLGEGGFKRARYAINVDSGRLLAIARLREDKESDECKLATRDEAEFLKKFVGEKGIAQCIRFMQVDGHRDGKVFLAMPVYDNGDLHHVIPKDLTDEEVQVLATDIMQGACALQRKGIIHRDLKPGNIFIDKNGHAHIADFGLATGVANSEDCGGTFEYFSPEYRRIWSKKYPTQAEYLAANTHKNDMWGIGCILYALWRRKTDTLPHEIWMQKGMPGGAEGYDKWLDSPGSIPTQDDIDSLKEDLRADDQLGQLVFSLLCTNYRERPSAEEAFQRYKAYLT